MKALRMILLGTFVPAVAFAQPQATPQTGSDSQPGSSEPSQPSQMSTNGTNAKDFGLTVKRMTPDEQSSYGGPKNTGLRVTQVDPDGVAAKAGVQPGDVITKIDGNPLSSGDDVKKAWMQDQSSGKPGASIEVVRNHKTLELQAKLDNSNQKAEGQIEGDPAGS